MNKLFFTGASILASAYASKHAYTGKCESNPVYDSSENIPVPNYIFKHTVIAAWYHSQLKIKQFPMN